MQRASLAGKPGMTKQRGLYSNKPHRSPSPKRTAATPSVSNLLGRAPSLSPQCDRLFSRGEQVAKQFGDADSPGKLAMGTRGSAGIALNLGNGLFPRILSRILLVIPSRSSTASRRFWRLLTRATGQNFMPVESERISPSFAPPLGRFSNFRVHTRGILVTDKTSQPLNPSVYVGGL